MILNCSDVLSEYRSEADSVVAVLDDLSSPVVASRLALGMVSRLRDVVNPGSVPSANSNGNCLLVVPSEIVCFVIICR